MVLVRKLGKSKTQIVKRRLRTISVLVEQGEGLLELGNLSGGGSEVSGVSCGVLGTGRAPEGGENEIWGMVPPATHHNGLKLGDLLLHVPASRMSASSGLGIHIGRTCSSVSWSAIVVV